MAVHIVQVVSRL